MTYTLDFALALGSGKAGLADLRAQLVDTGGANVGSAVSTGFVEIGAGNYLWHYAAIPDSHRGGVAFYSNATPATVLAFGAVNPEEAENADAKTSTRSVYAGADTAGTGTLLGRILGTLDTGTHKPQGGDAYAVVTSATYGNDALHTDIAAIPTSNPYGGPSADDVAAKILTTPANKLATDAT